MAQSTAHSVESDPIVDDPLLTRPPSPTSAQKGCDFASLATPGLPSPPLSCVSETFLDFDTAADLTFDSPCSPQSSVLVSPKSTQGATFTFDPGTDFSLDDPKLPIDNSLEATSTSTVEALSQHHLERYLHYKALAAQAEAELSFSLLNGQLLVNDDATLSTNMLAFQAPAQQMFNSQQNMWNQYQNVQHATAAQQQVIQNAQVQAQVHLQQAQAAANAAAQRSMSTNNYYMPSIQQQQQQQQQQSQSIWSHPSASTSVATESPPYPSTPTYSTTSGVPLTGSNLAINAASAFSEGEKEIDDDELHRSPVSLASPIANAHGGGRGYVPGKTPDDPKKRHKCQVCGRGFARAFNLKSHISTHDPQRPKPHQCPHHMCKRSFSRLHDLERHRQGIHSDGPLVDAKRQGVSPGVIRAQSRMRTRAESGGLI